MTRASYIKELEDIRNAVVATKSELAEIRLDDATAIETDRYCKPGKQIDNLCVRLYEDIAICTKVSMDIGKNDIQGDLFAGIEKDGGKE
jgi:hypothetical protein